MTRIESVRARYVGCSASLQQQIVAEQEAAYVCGYTQHANSQWVTCACCGHVSQICLAGLRAEGDVVECDGCVAALTLTRADSEMRWYARGGLLAYTVAEQAES